MFELPEDLTTLSDEELSNLLDEYATAFDEAAEAASTAEDVADLNRGADAIDALRGEQTRREDEAAEVERQVAEARARVTGSEPEGEGEEGAEGQGGEGAEGEGGEGEGGQGEGAEGEREPEPVSAGGAPARRQRAPLGEIRRNRPARRAPRPQAASPIEIVAGPDLRNFGAGQPIELNQMAQAFIDRHASLGRSTTVDGEVVPIATMRAPIPEGRHLRESASAVDNMALVAAVTDLFLAHLDLDAEGLTAAGGLCAPLAPYYEMMVLARAMRPVRDSLPSFGADRGGVTLIPPPNLADLAAAVSYITASQDQTTYGDGSSTNTSTAYTSLTANFTAADVGKAITGTNIPAGATIAAVVSATAITLSAAATGTGTGLTFTIVGRGDKACLHATCAASRNYTINAVSRCVEFGNFGARAFPEQVTAWLALAAAYHARRAETALLDGIAANSIATTAPAGVGAGPELIARAAQAAAGYRSRLRMEPDAVLDALFPSWTPDLVFADHARRTGDSPYTAQAINRQRVEAALRSVGIRPTWYVDSKTGGGQVIGAQSAGALLTFPTTMLWYLYAPGTFNFLDQGTLDFGLVRDSNLNTRNDYRVHVESLEGLAYFGIHSLEIAQSVCADGSAAAGRTLTCPV